MTITLDTLKEAVQIKEEIAKLEAQLSRILGGSTPAAAEAPAKRGRKPGRRKMSPAARAKIAAAAKARWAKARGSAPAPEKAVPGKRKKRGGISAEGRARLAAAMKARSAARKKGAPSPNAPKK